MIDEDVRLMLRLQQGDRAALGLLLQRNASRVLALAYRYLGDRAAAEDVVQETFLKVYQARDRYRPDAAFHAYLLRIATNVCLSQLRRRRGVSLDAGGDEEEGRRNDPASPGPPPGSALEDGEVAERVRAAVLQLPDRQRLAILLNKFEGLDYQQVADQLGLTTQATKSLLHRARMALKDALVASLGEELLTGLAKPEGAARVERDGSGP